jgi:hypothetical protein
MEKGIAIYISAAAEMDTECELVGQLLASLPKTIPWNIKRTPAPFEPANPDLVALRKSQFYLILLGMDIMAPIGVEWITARSAKLVFFAFRHTGKASSPAAAVFERDANIAWDSYQTPQEFIHKFERALITQLLEGSPGYGLELGDLEALATRLKALQSQESAAGTPDGVPEERRGAGRGGIILASVEP